MEIRSVTNEFCMNGSSGDVDKYLKNVQFPRVIYF